MSNQRRTRLFVATPCYGSIHPAFVHSVISACRVFEQEGVACGFSFDASADITVARNSLAATFLRSEADAVVFADADQQWDARDIVRWLRTDLAIIGAPIAKKQLQSALACLPAEPREMRDGYVRADSIGTGLLLVRRPVIEALASTASTYAERGSQRWCLFDALIGPDPAGGIRRLGEDISFLFRAQQAGFQAWIDPRARVTHFAGMVGFDVSDAQRGWLTGTC